VVPTKGTPQGGHHQPPAGQPLPRPTGLAVREPGLQKRALRRRHRRAGDQRRTSPRGPRRAPKVDDRSATDAPPRQDQAR
jgi:hypothetical protein